MKPLTITLKLNNKTTRELRYMKVKLYILAIVNRILTRLGFKNEHIR